MTVTPVALRKCSFQLTCGGRQVPTVRPFDRSIEVDDDRRVSTQYLSDWLDRDIDRLAGDRSDRWGYDITDAETGEILLVYRR